MKPLLVLLLLTAASAATWLALRTPAPSYEPPAAEQTAFPPAQLALPRPPAADEQIITLEITGMCCRGCTGKLEAAARKLPEVRAFAVEADLLTAHVLASASIQQGSLQNVLSFDPYEATVRP